MPDKDKKGRTNVEAGGDLSAGGDIVTGDKVSHSTSTSTTNIQEGGPVARYAVFGIIGIAALAIVVIAVLANRGNGNPPTPGPGTTAPATHRPSDTPVPPSATPTPSATLAPSDTPTTAPTAFDTPVPTLAPTPTSVVEVFDDFSDNCLEANRWILDDERRGLATPIPRRGNCLDPRRQFMAQDDGRLSVFIDQDATRDTEQTYAFDPLTGSACYRQVEVVAAVDNAQSLAEASRAFLFTGIYIERLAGDGYLQVRLEGTNTAGAFLTQAIARLILADDSGYQNFTILPYKLGQVVTVAFRVKGNRLTAYVDDTPIAGPFPIIADPCQIAIGYHADTQTLLDAYFDEVRIQYAP